ncbi:MAG: hypothetical protein LBM71_03530, partial [Elusimicrobiota bacterium]|nr:hypothetical protein [Elusimicrobiota bacterium]
MESFAQVANKNHSAFSGPVQNRQAKSKYRNVSTIIEDTVGVNGNIKKILSDSAKEGDKLSKALEEGYIKAQQNKFPSFEEAEKDIAKILKNANKNKGKKENDFTKSIRNSRNSLGSKGLNDSEIDSILKKALYEIFKENDAEDIKDIFLVAKYFAKDDYEIEANIRYYFNKAVDSGAVNIETIGTVSREAFAKGAASAYLKYIMNDVAKYGVNREIMLSQLSLLAELINENGLLENDVPVFIKYLKLILKDGAKSCDISKKAVDYAPGLGNKFNGQSNGKKADNEIRKEARQKECANLAVALYLLGVFTSKLPLQERTANSDLIYKTLLESHEGEYAYEAMIIKPAIEGLMATGIVSAYNHIEKFLLTDISPQGTKGRKAKNVVGAIFDLVTPSSLLFSKEIQMLNALRANGGGKYLDWISARYEYIDENAAKGMKFSRAFIERAKDNPSVAYNVPYRNILEDIGFMIAQTPTKQAQQLAHKILKKYINLAATHDMVKRKYAAANMIVEKARTLDPSAHINIPLVVGIVQGEKLGGTDLQAKAAHLLHKYDWWDLSEGTQRRINNAPLKNKKLAGFTAVSEDAMKKRRAAYNERLQKLGMWADVLVSAIFTGQILLSLPSIIG